MPDDDEHAMHDDEHHMIDEYNTMLDDEHAMADAYLAMSMPAGVCACALPRRKRKTVRETLLKWHPGAEHVGVDSTCGVCACLLTSARMLDC